MAEFLNMGGYAVTVWASWGVTAVFLVGLLLVSLRQAARRRTILKDLEAELGRSRRT